MRKREREWELETVVGRFTFSLSDVRRAIKNPALVTVSCQGGTEEDGRPPAVPAGPGPLRTEIGHGMNGGKMEALR